MDSLANLKILCFIISFIHGCFGCTGSDCSPQFIVFGFVGFCGAIMVIYLLMICFCREKLHVRRHWGVRNTNRIHVNTMPTTTTTTVHVTANPPVQLPPAHPPVQPLPAHPSVQPPPAHPPAYRYTDPLQPAYPQQQGYPKQTAYRQQPTCPPQPAYSQNPAYPQQPTCPPQPAYSQNPSYPQQPTCPPQPAYSQQPTCPQEPDCPKKNLKFLD